MVDQYKVERHKAVICYNFVVFLLNSLTYNKMLKFELKNVEISHLYLFQKNFFCFAQKQSLFCCICLFDRVTLN